MASVSEEVNIGASFFLPDEIVFDILSKVTDFKTLCICKRVSRRFYKIAYQVDTIFLIAPSSWTTDNSEFREDVNSFAALKRHHYKDFYPTRTGRRFIGGLIDSIAKFTRLKSLYIELPLISFKHLPFLKWKVFIDSNGINSFVIMSPTSILDIHLWFRQFAIASMYLKEAIVRYRMLFGFAHECPFLEKISITDSCKIGRVSLSGAKLSEARKSSKVQTFRHKVSWCRIPSLDLPVAGFVMKRVKLILFEDAHHLPNDDRRYDRYISNIDDVDFEDKEEAAYSEAVREIFKKHRDLIRQWVGEW